MKDATLRQAAKILSIFNETSVEQVQTIIESGLLADLRDGNIDGVNRDAFRQLIGLKRLDTYTLTIDYNRSVEDGVKAGQYDYANSDITSKHFPTERMGMPEVAVELIHFNRDISTDEAIHELDRMGYRPADLHELLALGEKYPDLQREFPVIALGSVWQKPGGFRSCAYLDGNDSRRYLYLDWVDFRWDDYCRFAAVRK